MTETDDAIRTTWYRRRPDGVRLQVPTALATSEVNTALATQRADLPDVVGREVVWSIVQKSRLHIGERGFQFRQEGGIVGNHAGDD